MKTFQTQDGVSWNVVVQLPGASNALVLFKYPGVNHHLDRYAWYLSHGPEARNVTARLKPLDVLTQLDDSTLTRLFRRSMPVSAGASPLLPGA